MISYEYTIDDGGYFNIFLSQSDMRIYADAENTVIESSDKSSALRKTICVIFAMRAIQFLPDCRAMKLSKEIPIAF